MADLATAAFNTLTHNEQIERLTHFAGQALDGFGMTGADITFLSYTNNTLFRVQHENAAYVLRVHRPGLKQPVWIRSELTWLGALHQETSLTVPQPTGDFYTGTLEGVDIPVHAVLFRWIEGESITADSLTLEQVAQIGRFAAHLHGFSAKFTPPPDFVRPHLNFDGLFGEDSPYHAGDAGEQLIKERGGEVIKQVTAQVQRVMNRLGQHTDTYGMIHADLLPKNLLWHDGQMGAVDFDDCAFGFYLYDLAPILLGFKTQPAYDDVRSALWSGYHEGRTMHRAALEDLETLIAGRYVASIRWVAGNAGHPAIRDRAPQIISERIVQLKDFLNTGILTLV